eukprot:8887109-Pyramimonas_sp.AAC.1
MLKLKAPIQVLFGPGHLSKGRVPHLCVRNVPLAGGVDWAGTFAFLFRLVQGGRLARSKYTARVSNCAYVALRSLVWSLGGSFRGSPG